MTNTFKDYLDTLNDVPQVDGNPTDENDSGSARVIEGLEFAAASLLEHVKILKQDKPDPHSYHGFNDLEYVAEFINEVSEIVNNYMDDPVNGAGAEFIPTE